jgi:predicted nucleic acid-binding Zn ribbon protein
MGKKGFQDIQQVLSKVLKNFSLENQVKKEQLFNNWNNIVGNELAEKCSPIKIENKTLFLKTKNSVWRNELKLRQNDLLKIIYEKTGNKLITNITFL